MDSPAPISSTTATPAITNPSNLANQIFLDSAVFTPHTPTQRLVFESFHEGLDLAFGSMRFHVNTIGTVRLPDPICADPTDPDASPIISPLIRARIRRTLRISDPSDTTYLTAPSDALVPSDPTDPATLPDSTAPTDPSSSASSSSSGSVDNLARRSTPPMIRRMLPDDEHLPAPRPLPLQCAMAHGRTGEAAGEDRTRDNRRSTNNGRDNRSHDNRRTDDNGRDRTRGNSRTRNSGRSGESNGYPDDDEPSRDESLDRLQVRVSAAAFQRIKEIVHGRGVMPRNASYDEWLCYQKLLFRRQEFLRKQEENLNRRKEAADASSIRRAQLSSMRSSQSRNTVTGRSKMQSRLPNLSAQDRVDLTRNMTDIGLDPAHLAPKTPEAGLQAAAAYLLANSPPANTPLAAGYTNALAGLGMAQSVLPSNPNQQATAPRQQNRASP